MRRKSKKYILPALLVIIALGSFIGYGIWNTPHEDIKNAPAVKISAEELYNALADNGTDTKAMYVNKVLELSGTVRQVSENQQKQQVVLLETDVQGGSVNCTMEESIINIKVGDSIVLKGICMGYSGGDQDMELPGDVFLIRCYHEG